MENKEIDTEEEIMEAEARQYWIESWNLERAMLQ